MAIKPRVSNFFKGALLSTALLSGANKFANAQTFNDPSCSVPNYIQSLKTSQDQKGQIKGAVCFFSYKDNLYYLWNDGKVFSEKGDSFSLNNGKFVSNTGVNMPNEFNQELQKSLDIVNLKERQDNARVVDYFSYKNPKTNENNVFMVFSDGSVGFKYGMYSMGMNGSFYDQNNNKVFDGKDIFMSEVFSDKYGSKLEDVLSKNGSPSQLVILPINPKERTDMNNSLLNYKYYKNQIGKNNQSENRNENEEPKTVTVTQLVENPYNPKPLEDRLNLLDEKISNLVSKPSAEPTIIKESTTIENPYNPKPLEDRLNLLDEKFSNVNQRVSGLENQPVVNYNEKIETLSKEIQDTKSQLELTLADSLVGVSKNNQSLIDKKYNELSNKISELETSLISTKLDVDSLYSNKSVPSEEKMMQKPYDDSQLRGEIANLKEQVGKFEEYINKSKTESKKETTTETPTTPKVLITTEVPKETTNEITKETPKEQPKPKEEIIESKGNVNETVIESKGTQISQIIGSDEVQELTEEQKKNYETSTKKPIKRNPGLYIIGEPVMALDKNGYAGFGINTGFIYNFNDTVGVGAKILFKGLKDQLLESYKGEVSPITKRYAQGTKTATNLTGIGGDLELRIGPVLLGAGAEIRSGIENTLEEIMKQTEDGNEVLRSNTSSIGYSINSVNGYIGLDLPLTENITGRIFGGYESHGAGEGSGFFGIGTSIRLGNKQENKSNQDKKQ